MAETGPVLTASCICGNIKLILTGPPTMTYLCHCLNCRKETGGLCAVQLEYPKSNVAISTTTTATNDGGGVGDVNEQLSKYSYENPDDPQPSPPNGARCKHCGCPIWCDLGGDEILVRWGLVDAEGEEAQRALDGFVDDAKPTAFKPVDEYFCKRKPAWAREWNVQGANQRREMAKS